MIDCDLRKSEIRNKYNIRSDEAITGVAHYLAGKATLDDATYQTNVPNGYMIPVNATVANPSILLENDRFGRMIQASRERFGCVLIDTPPLGSVADALKIATHCDGTVLVVRSGDTPRKLVEDSVQLLRRTETPLLGVVLNRADIGSKSNILSDATTVRAITTMGMATDRRSINEVKIGGNNNEKNRLFPRWPRWRWLLFAMPAAAWQPSRVQQSGTGTAASTPSGTTSTELEVVNEVPHRHGWQGHQRGDLPEPLIKVTAVADTLAANEKFGADLSFSQKAGES